MNKINDSKIDLTLHNLSTYIYARICAGHFIFLKMNKKMKFIIFIFFLIISININNCLPKSNEKYLKIKHKTFTQYPVNISIILFNHK